MHNVAKFISDTKQLLIVLLLFLFFAGCEEIEPVLHDVNTQEQTIVQYVLNENNKEKYSLFGEIVDKANLINLLSVRGPYTLFLPHNQAVKDYLTEISVSSVEQLSDEKCKELVYNHLFDIRISSGEIGLGALIKVNALGDYISSEFIGADILINKESKISKRDIFTANGVIHEIDKVIKPVTDNVATILALQDGYTIFNEALSITGLIDTLNVVEFEYGSFLARTRFTVLAVSDEVYQAEGVNTIDDLIREFTDDPEAINSRDNGFFRYVEYHLIRDVFFLNHLQRGDYPNIANENFISITLENDYEINKTDSSYTSFNIPHSNIPAKNGVIHSLNDILPAREPRPWKVIFDITDYIDFRESDFYKQRETLAPGENIFKKFYDGENTFEFIKWTGDYLQYYYRVNDWKVGDYINGDCLTMSGFWSIEVTVPRIMKGRYNIHAFTRSGPDCLVYIDGQIQDHLYKMSDGGDNVIPRFIGTVNWAESSTHKIELVNLTPGLVFYDRLEFTPVLD